MKSAHIILFNKPYGVLTQFTDINQRNTLASFINQPGFYPAGRLDKDSEGLVLLTNNAELQHKITDPKFKLQKSYWVQVENIPSLTAIELLRNGVQLRDGMTRPANIELIAQPDIWPRYPAIRYRKEIPTCWLEIKITEGRNRQIRRMTAAVGNPTLRLIRFAIGTWQLGDLKSGEFILMKL